MAISEEAQPAAQGFLEESLANSTKTERTVSANTKSEEALQNEMQAVTAEIDMSDPRTYTSKFVAPKKSAGGAQFADVESVAAIVRNSELEDPAKFVTPSDMRAQFGTSKPGRSVENTSEYLERSTGFTLSPQAVRFRSHDAIDGHYAMFVRGSESIERIAYGQVSGKDRMIFEPVKGKEFNWQQLNQFGRRVIAAHRLERLGAQTAETIKLASTPEEEALTAVKNALLINPPDERGGITRVNNIECVAAVLRNNLFCGELKPFENVLDVQREFGNSLIARRLSGDQARLFSKSYLEMASGAKLDAASPFYQSEAEPGHYALFFDTQSKLPQVAYGHVAEDGTRYIYYPRTDKQLPLESMHNSNLETFRVDPAAKVPPTAAAETSAHLTAEQIASGKHTMPLDTGTNIDFAGTVTHLLRFRSGKSNAVLQNFILQSEAGNELRIVHNVSGTGLIPLQKGDQISIRGQYAVNHSGQGILHWTHKSGPESNGVYGWVQLGDKRYW